MPVNLLFPRSAPPAPRNCRPTPPIYCVPACPRGKTLTLSREPPRLCRNFFSRREFPISSTSVVRHPARMDATARHKRFKGAVPFNPRFILNRMTSGLVITKAWQARLREFFLPSERRRILSAFRGRIQVNGVTSSPLASRGRPMVNVDTHILVFALTGEVTDRERRVLASNTWTRVRDCLLGACQARAARSNRYRSG